MGLVRYRQKMDGGLLCCSVSAAPQRNGRGEPVGVTFIIEDITERRRAEDEIRRQKEIFQKIFDNVPITLNFFDADGRLLLVNREWERMFGWTQKELEEGNVDIFAEAMTGPRETRRAGDFVAAASGEWADFKIKRRDGTTVDVLGAVVLLSDGTRLSIAQDITERKRAEEQLKRSNEELRIVSDRSSRLVFASDDAREGPAAFVEKRAPNWTCG